jgi:hypothetical protein
MTSKNAHRQRDFLLHPATARVVHLVIWGIMTGIYRVAALTDRVQDFEPPLAKGSAIDGVSGIGVDLDGFEEKAAAVADAACSLLPDVARGLMDMFLAALPAV